MRLDRNYWLLKSEPNDFSIADLKKLGKKGEPWDGIRNYQARNFLRAMQPGDLAFIYHSACEIPAVVGVAEVINSAYPDQKALDSSSKYYDEKSTPNNIRWSVVDVRFKSELKRAVSLKEIKSVPELSDMRLVKSARLSVSPVKKDEFNIILTLGGHQSL